MSNIGKQRSTLAVKLFKRISFAKPLACEKRTAQQFSFETESQIPKLEPSCTAE